MMFNNSSLINCFISNYYKICQGTYLGFICVLLISYANYDFLFYLFGLLKFNNKMTACISCRTLVELMKNQINELINKEKQLLRVNNALTQALKKTENSSQLQGESWKVKYEQEARINNELRKRITELQNHQKKHIYSTFDEPATPKRQPRKSEYQSGSQLISGHNENQRSNSITRMDEFMKSVGMPKVGQFSTRRNTLTNIKKNKGQIVLRIVDQRLNRRY